MAFSSCSILSQCLGALSVTLWSPNQILGFEVGTQSVSRQHKRVGTVFFEAFAICVYIYTHMNTHKHPPSPKPDPRQSASHSNQTAEILLEKIASGVFYPNTLQQIAKANVADGLSNMTPMAELGQGGLRPANVERDLLALVRKTYGWPLA